MITLQNSTNSSNVMVQFYTLYLCVKLFYKILLDFDFFFAKVLHIVSREMLEHCGWFLGFWVVSEELLEGC